MRRNVEILLPLQMRSFVRTYSYIYAIDFFYNKDMYWRRSTYKYISNRSEDYCFWQLFYIFDRFMNMLKGKMSWNGAKLVEEMTKIKESRCVVDRKAFSTVGDRHSICHSSYHIPPTNPAFHRRTGSTIVLLLWAPRRFVVWIKQRLKLGIFRGRLCPLPYTHKNAQYPACGKRYPGP